MHFFSEQLRGSFWLRDVVHACRAAADLRARQFHNFQAGNGAKELAWRFTDSLAVEQVAGILIGNASTNRSERRGEAEGGEEFGDVPCASSEGYSRGVIGLGSDEQMIIFLERGAAAGGVGDDGVEVICSEGHEVPASQVAGNIAESSVQREGAATELRSRDDDFAAICSEDANGGFVEGSKSDVGYATGEESYAGTAFASGGIDFAKVVEKKA